MNEDNRQNASSKRVLAFLAQTHPDHNHNAAFLRELMLSAPLEFAEYDPDLFGLWSCETISDPDMRTSFLEALPEESEEGVLSADSALVIERVKSMGVLGLVAADLIRILSERRLLLAVGEHLDKGCPPEEAADPVALAAAKVELKRLFGEESNPTPLAGSDPSDPIPGEAGGERQADWPRVEGHRVWRGADVERLMGEHLRVARPQEVPSTIRTLSEWEDDTEMRVLGMFQPDCGEGSGPPTCLVVAWTLRGGGVPNRFAGGLCLDELAFFASEGSSTWEFDGGEPVRLAAETGVGTDLLWMSGAPSLGAGIPPFTVTIHGSRRAYGFAVLYNALGVPYKLDPRDGFVKVEGCDQSWDSAELEAYWAGIGRHVKHMPPRAPFVATIPLGDDGVDRLGQPRKADFHWRAAKKGQLKAYRLRAWPRKKQFKGATGLMHPGAMLDFSLVRLPVEGSKLPLELAVHKGCYEFIVPLHKSLVAAVARQGFRFDEDPTDENRFVRSGSELSKMVLKSGALRNGAPDVLMLNSGFYHGFAAAGASDAYFLGFRCHDAFLELPRKEDGRTESSVPDRRLRFGVRR